MRLMYERIAPYRFEELTDQIGPHGYLHIGFISKQRATIIKIDKVGGILRDIIETSQVFHARNGFGCLCCPLDLT